MDLIAGRSRGVRRSSRPISNAATAALTTATAIHNRGERRTGNAASRHQASRRILEKWGFVRDPNWSQQAEYPNLAPGVQQDDLRYELRFTPNA